MKAHLLGAGQHSWRVDKRQFLQQLGFHGRALEAVEEARTEFREGSERFVGLHDKRITGDDPLIAAMHNGHESVCGGLRANANTREVALQDVLDERSFTGRILADQHDERDGVKVRILQQGMEKFVEEVHLLNVPHVLLVQGLQTGQHRRVDAVLGILKVWDFLELALVHRVLLLQHLEQLHLTAAVRLEHGVHRRKLFGSMVLVELDEFLAVRHGFRALLCVFFSGTVPSCFILLLSSSFSWTFFILLLDTAIQQVVNYQTYNNSPEWPVQGFLNL